MTEKLSLTHSMDSCHLLISSASVRSLPFLSFVVLILAWNVPLISPVFLKRSLVFPFCCFPLFLFYFRHNMNSEYMSISIFQFILPSLLSIHSFSTSVFLFLFCKWDHLYHFSIFHIYMLTYDTWFSLSDYTFYDSDVLWFIDLVFSLVTAFLCLTEMIASLSAIHSLEEYFLFVGYLSMKSSSILAPQNGMCIEKKKFEGLNLKWPCWQGVLFKSDDGHFSFFGILGYLQVKLWVPYLGLNVSGHSLCRYSLMILNNAFSLFS